MRSRKGAEIGAGDADVIEIDSPTLIHARLPRDISAIAEGGIQGPPCWIPTFAEMTEKPALRANRDDAS